MKKLFIILVLFILTGCAKEEIEVKTSITFIDNTEANEMISSDDVYILDVRTKEEFDTCHIDGANLIPYDQIESRIGEIPKDKKILVYCRTSNRAKVAADYLNSFDVYILNTGFSMWINQC